MRRLTIQASFPTPWRLHAREAVELDRDAAGG
jgi:hypothetical protein